MVSTHGSVVPLAMFLHKSYCLSPCHLSRPHQRPDHPFLHQTRYIHAPPPLVFNILKKSQYCFCKPLFLCTLWVARSMEALYARVAGPCNAWSLIIGRSVYLAWVGDDMIIIILADLIHEGWWYIINHCLSFIYPILTFATNLISWPSFVQNPHSGTRGGISV